MDKWLKDILPDKDPYHNRGRDQVRKKGGPEFECLWIEQLPDGGNIIIVIKVKTVKPVVIICAYLPCRGSNSADSYQEILNELCEIKVKYSIYRRYHFCWRYECVLNKTLISR